MTGKDLLIWLGDISQKYYDEAENGSVSSYAKQLTLRRSLLIAAVVSLLLLLVGCAIAYSLRLQDMSIGKEAYTQSFDDSGKAIDPVEKTRDIITLYGHNRDPIQLAITEWTEFLAAYDPEFKLADNIPDHSEIPNNLELTYSCYTSEMADKLIEIAAKYDLKLLDEWIPFQQYQSDIFLEETGIGSLVLQDSGAKVSQMAGMFYPPYNFSMEFTLKTDDLIPVSARINYARKDYFPRAFPGGVDLDQYAQWDYTASDGTPLLMALGSKGQALIIADRSDAMLIVSIEGNFSGSAYPNPDQIITKEQLERIADVFDYSIQPGTVDRTAVQLRLDAAEAEYQSENTFIEPVYYSFSDFIKRNYLLVDDAWQYTFYDLTGDGEMELLIGKDGGIDTWATVRDGEIRSRMLNMTYLCEGGVLESYDKYDIYESHIFHAPVSETVIDDLDREMVQLDHVLRTGDQWVDCTVMDEHGIPKQITAAQAQAIIGKYTRITLNWSPLMDYPLAEGYTLRDYLNEKDVRVSGTELREIYRDYLLEQDAKGYMNYSHYRILDINGDDVDDLLLKYEDNSFIGKTDSYWLALTYRYGRIMDIQTDGNFYLCENGVLECVDTRHQGMGAEVDGHTFIRMDGFEQQFCGFAAYSKATARWYGDWHNEVPLTEAEANAILAKYPRIDQGMLPISELLNIQ